MNKNGGYTWVQTCATVVCNSKNADEQNIICVNYIISGLEFEHLVMDSCQLEETKQTVKHEEGTGNDPENRSPDADRGGKYIQLYSRSRSYFFSLSTRTRSCRGHQGVNPQDVRGRQGFCCYAR